MKPPFFIEDIIIRKRIVVFWKLFYVVLLFSGFIMLLVIGTRLSEESINTNTIYTIAASDSSIDDKASANAVCTGISDQDIINSNLDSGNTVKLCAGTYEINGHILPKTGSRLIGVGDGSIINLNNVSIEMIDVSNVEIDNLKLIGTSKSAVFIACYRTDIAEVNISNITCQVKGGDDFTIYGNGNHRLSHIVFNTCAALNPDGFGFIINGEGTTPMVEDVTFYKCTVENAGVAATRTGDWVTGIDLAEYAFLSVARIQVIDCTVNGSWESAFHMETAPEKSAIVITHCTATNAGLKNGRAVYGAGFIIDGTDDVILNHNAGSNNHIADFRIWNGSSYDNYTSRQDEILPADSIKKVTTVSQGNCRGTIVTNEIYKDLLLFSFDGNPVNQQIELGGYYTSNDGNTYIFNKTKVTAQFVDYAVMRLIETSPDLTSEITHNVSSLMGFHFSINLTPLTMSYFRGAISFMTISTSIFHWMSRLGYRKKDQKWPLEAADMREKC